MTDTRQSAPNPDSNDATMGLAERIGRALNGRRTSKGWSICCPCPSHGKGHGDSNPSLSISDGDGGRFLAKCHAGCSFEAVIAALEARGLMSEDWRDAQPASTPRPPQPRIPDEYALKIWNSSRPVTPDGIVARYLQGRGITTIGVPPTLREASPLVGRRVMPMMLAALQIQIEGEPFGQIVAVQKTFLNVSQYHKGVTRVNRVNHGSTFDGAVRFGKAEDVLGLAEGTETALSAMQLTGIPVWACLGSQRMAKVAIPKSVRELRIFGDDDEAGRIAVKETIDAHRHRIKVTWHYPPVGFSDWNDALTGFYQPKGINDWRDIAKQQNAEKPA